MATLLYACILHVFAPLPSLATGILLHLASLGQTYRAPSGWGPTSESSLLHLFHLKASFPSLARWWYSKYLQRILYQKMYSWQIWNWIRLQSLTCKTLPVPAAFSLRKGLCGLSLILLYLNLVKYKLCQWLLDMSKVTDISRICRQVLKNKAPVTPGRTIKQQLWFCKHY